MASACGVPVNPARLWLVPFHAVVEEWDAGLTAGNPLDFVGYIAPSVEDVGSSASGRAAVSEGGEAVRTGRTENYAFVESRFDVHGGTMGVAVGEKVVRAYERACRGSLPIVVVTRTGGARVQEGMLALAQLARTATAARRHAETGLLSLGLYGSPTTGGVFASYASLVDVRAAHQDAVIGFAGPRVAEDALGVRLPAGAHTARLLHDHGMLDALVEVGDEATWLEAALGMRDRPLPKRALPVVDEPEEPGAWGEVLRARAPGRPTGIDRAARLCSSWTELRGSDATVRAGLATIAGARCVVVATDRYHGEGRPKPAGYRLAQRAVALAGRLGLPVVTLVDTPGADPSPEAEADGIGIEIARTFAALAGCPTPTVAVCVGEGGSGGALALSHADRLLMCEHAIFSVIGPEGAAAILERDARKAPQLAEQLKLTANDLVAMGVADMVIPEEDEGFAEAVIGALAQATIGDRDRRLHVASHRWLTE